MTLLKLERTFISKRTYRENMYKKTSCHNKTKNIYKCSKTDNYLRDIQTHTINKVIKMPAKKLGLIELFMSFGVKLHNVTLIHTNHEMIDTKNNQMQKQSFFTCSMV